MVGFACIIDRSNKQSLKIKKQIISQVKIKIPEGTQTGKLFRLRGKGISPIRGVSTGDLLCRAVIETPQNLSKDQKQLLKEFQASISDDSRQNPLRDEWFSKVKSFFDTSN